MKTSLRNTNKNIRVDDIEELPGYDPNYMRGRTIEKNLIAWGNLGNSKNRTSQQKELASKVTADYLTSLDRNKIVAFTDGSALHHPGPCGAGAAVYLSGLDCHPVRLQKAISPKSTSYHGELAAIKLALDCLVSSNLKPGINGIIILTDCQAALQTLCNTSRPTNFINLTHQIIETTQHLEKRGIAVSLTWVAGHAGLEGNEIADACAKAGAEETKSLSDELDDTTVTLTEARTQVKEGRTRRWQQSWDRVDVGRHLHNLQPTVATSFLNVSAGRKVDKMTNRLRSGATSLKSNLWKMKLPGIVGPECSCGFADQTIEHVLLDCLQHVEARSVLIREIEEEFVTADIPPHNRSINISLLLAGNPELTVQSQETIRGAFNTFLRTLHTSI